MIGQLVAKKLAGFEPRFLGYDPYVKPEDVQHLGVEMVDLDTLLKEADFVTLHARLTEENEHLLGERELGLMKPTAIIINTARSGLIDEEALYKALKERRIGGAALDVFDVEPPGKDYPLVTLDNCTVTTHMAGTTKDALLNAPKLLAQRMLCLVQEEGEPRFPGQQGGGRLPPAAVTAEETGPPRGQETGEDRTPGQSRGFLLKRRNFSSPGRNKEDNVKRVKAGGRTKEGGSTMKIVVLDGYTLNPGDLSWAGLEKHGEVRCMTAPSYDAAGEELVIERARDAEIVFLPTRRYSRGEFWRSRPGSSIEGSWPPAMTLSM